MDWSLRACGRRGHETYAPDEPELRERLHATTPAGEAWRCLRCTDFVVGPAKGGGPADEAPIVLRDRALRDATILRLLAAERLIRGVIILAIAYGVVRFRSAQHDLRAAFERALPAAKPLQDALHVNLTDSAFVHRLQHVLESRPHTLALIAVGLFAYAGLQLVEGVGLWMLKRWGEYVAVVGTSAFIPLEVYELVERVTVLRVGALIINVAAVAYLVWTKRLFGVRGGHAAFEAERHSESLLEVEAAASQGKPLHEE
ncbi:MAG: hypothetical protein QOJ79_3010 [Actinomycetota bacterium]|jgi:uncharacterized membrane protein (DUF2068 family)|nr:hypothetical protein [Actinomycetota bacterium]